ncbi:DgyrCDS14465 [Dimorphilus gyrociliatus]|uniref:DgyrCDS14465 n=1 Tax=Dimorphilus gyrociliatus TaxID=2664684 RepID=A0A7I8WDW3_9ANNE|nr:DgyrCDS14465 [Dimorphilus gyrociliatus]
MLIYFEDINSAILSKNEILNCEQGQTTNRVQSCGVCQSGTIHSADRLSCYKCPDYCALGSCKLKSDSSNPDDATFCEKCIEHYFMNNGKCHECLPGCKKCNSISKCQDCLENFAIRKNFNDCIPCPHNCEQCNWLTTTFSVQCEICKAGYTVQNKNCVACGSFCKSCRYLKSKGVTCTTCDSNTYQETNNNITTCKPCSTSITGCSKCSNKDTCTECISKSYALTTSKQCEKCSSVHTACLECEAHSNTNKCSKCSIGYYLKDDSCSPCPRNCHSCIETNNVVKCSKCMAEYTVVAREVCDKCPDNCLECEVSSGNLICKADKCKAKYTRNSNNLCSKCPEKCNKCTWNSAKFRAECTGTNSVHSCTEKENGKSWTLSSDGTCAACPNYCDKCYFEKSTATTPICYASMCQQTYTYDDLTGICIPCPIGCDYCKKRTGGLTCLECSRGFAPNYGNSSTVIESCMACSINNCKYCEVISNELKCIRSPCTNSTTGKFSFKTGTCHDPLVSGTSFSTLSDESDHFSDDVLYDYDYEVIPMPCPPGSILIDVGIYRGHCRSCGYNCEDCQLNNLNTDVECKTCIGNTQWVNIEINGMPTRGCYDCTIARLQCTTFERFGSAPNFKCRCKIGHCMGNQDNPKFVTALQDTNDEYNKCQACSEKFPNALACSTEDPDNLTVHSCATGFTKLQSNDKACFKIGEFCSKWTDISSVICTACAFGSYLSSGECLPCPDGCSECTFEGSIINCISCSNGKTGIDCQSSPSVCDSINVENCNIKWNIAVSGSTPNCKCLSCSNSSAVDNIVPNTKNILGTCTSSGISTYPPNCQQVMLGTNTCTKCTGLYSLVYGMCLKIHDDCKSGFTVYEVYARRCFVPKPDFVLTKFGLENVSKSRYGGRHCTGYVLTGGQSNYYSRCSGCAAGYVLDSSNPYQYICWECNILTLLHCSHAVVDNHVCKCGRCTADGGGKHYLKHPTHAGCMEIADISECNDYTLKKKAGTYISVCNECSEGNIVSKDGQSCLSCGTCTNGIHQLNSIGDACECTCSNATLMNSNSNGCINCTNQIANCKVYELDNDICTCSECLAGHLKKSNTECNNCESDITCNGGTAQLNSGGDACECICSNTTFMNSNSNGCINCTNQIANCKVYELDNDVCKCSECLAGHVKKSNTEYGDACECICSNNTFMNSNSNGCVNCTNQIANCEVYELDNDVCKCSECSANYILKRNSECVECPSELICNGGTKRLNSGGNSCECTCSNNALINFNLNGCINCSTNEISNCKIFDLVNDICTCSECLSNYELQGNSECIYNTPGGGGETIANCLEYTRAAGLSTISECTKCIAGWALEEASSTSTSKCHQCQLGCEICTVDTSSTLTTVNRCTACSRSYAINNVGACIQCPYNCDECRVDPENQNNAICLSFGCTSGALNDADFSCQSCSIANCAICVQQINGLFKCLKCNRGFYKDHDGICQACTENCPFCFDDQSCIPDGCDEGFIRHRTEGTCLPCIGDGVARCSFQTATSNILIPETCKIGFRLNLSTHPPLCERCDPNCKICIVNGATKCDDQQCNSGYFYDSIDQKCYREKARCEKSIRICPSGCSACSLVDDKVQCTACIPSYGLREGLCEKCNSDKCQNCKIPPGESSMVCSSCLEKYYLNADDCGKCPSYCKECTHNGNYQCKTCMKRYGRSPDGTCIPCPPNCQTCIANSNHISKCTKCISNEFSLQSDGKCIPCSSATFTNCATCTSESFNRKAVCKSCQTGFSLSDDEESCISCSISKCSVCIHGNICSKCKSGFYLMNYNRECAQKCYKCKGNQADCGNEISNSNNNTSKMEIIDCSIGDCWAYRTETSDKIEYIRGCSNETCTSEATNEICKTANGKTECEKCCQGDKCNTWELDGKAGVEKTNYTFQFIAISIIFSILFSKI